MRIIHSREDGSEYLFLRRGGQVCLDNVHEKTELVRFASSRDAAELLQRLAHSPVERAALRALLPAYAGLTRLSPAAALRRVAELLWRGELVLHRRRYSRTAYYLEHSPGSSAAAAPRPSPRPTVLEELDTFPLNHDAPAQANALKEAAQAGVPFCEECQKAR